MDCTVFIEHILHTVFLFVFFQDSGLFGVELLEGLFTCETWLSLLCCWFKVHGVNNCEVFALFCKSSKDPACSALRWCTGLAREWSAGRSSAAPALEAHTVSLPILCLCFCLFLFAASWLFIFLLKPQNQFETSNFWSQKLTWTEFNNLSSGFEDLDANGKEIIPGCYGRPVAWREAHRTEEGEVVIHSTHIYWVSGRF